jgi:MFS family permease
MSEYLRHAKRTALTLSAAQAIVGSAAPICIALGGLAGSHLLGADKSFATLPVTGFNIGVALGALPAAWLMNRIGRRKGFMGGTGFTAVGGLIAAFALFQSSFVLFAFGLLLVGCGNAFAQQYRFAAADNAPDLFKPRSISWVLAGGIVAAVLGPQIIIHTRTMFDPVPFAGAYASLVILAAVGALVLSTLKLAPKPDVEDEVPDMPVRPLGDIIRQPQFIIALSCAIGTYALMSFVMTGAPMAMVGHGHSQDHAAMGISWHVMAMFGPSFFTGRLINRFGKETIVATGMALLVGCALVALTGLSLGHFWLALILLGVGWNFGFIGSTAMVAETYRHAERNKVQGVHDFLLFGSVAIASLMSGIVYNHYGWEGLNLVIFPVTAICLGLIVWLLVRARRLSTV